jgi:hypothetical protein
LALATEEEATVVETGTKKHTSVRKATVKDAFPWAEFEMVIEWDVSPNSNSLHSRLVLGGLEPDGSRRILGLLELEPPDAKKKEVLREGHLGAPFFGRGPGTHSKSKAAPTAPTDENSGSPPATRQYVNYPRTRQVLPVILATKRARDGEGGMLGNSRIQVVEDEGDGSYLSKFAADYCVIGYSDEALVSADICNLIRVSLVGNVYDRWCTVFGARDNTLFRKDAITVVTQSGDVNPWLNDSIIWGFIQLLRGFERRRC